MKDECQSKYCLYNLLQRFKGNSEVSFIHIDNYSSVVGLKSAWPNFTFDVKLSSKTIVDLSAAMRSEEISEYLLLDLLDAEKYESELQNNFTPLEFWPCMQMPNVIQFPKENLIQITFEKVTDLDQIVRWTNLANHGFGNLNSNMMYQLISSETELYIGKMEQEDVVSVMIDYHEKSAGIYYLVTKPEKKKLGIGTATFVHCQKVIASRGEFDLRIQSTKEGYKTWRKMGMQDCGNLVLMKYNR